jgi:hypothetical protein
MNLRVHALVNATFVQRMAFAIDRGFFATGYKSGTIFTNADPITQRARATTSFKPFAP